MSAQKPREIAARVLHLRETRAEYVENLLESELSGATLSPADHGLTRELVYGVARWQATLDWLIARKTEGRSQKAPLQILLRLGLYQMFWLDRIPDHAAVNETVELARQLGFESQAGFINAVLRGYAREREETKMRLEDLKVRQPHLGWSHPQWLCERWHQRWGAESARQLLEWNNTPPPTYARVNTLKTTPALLAAAWETEGVKFAARSWDWTGEGLVFELESHPPLAGLPSFQQGGFYIQDPGTLLAVHLLDPQPGESVLDLCAAPGGKTTYIAQRLQNRGRILAQEGYSGRLSLMDENCERLGATCVVTGRPTSIVLPELTAQFDRVLADVPCSNTGVMRRRVDLRWRVRPEEIERLRTVQLEILERGAVQVKPAGVFIYSTCSLEPEENGEVVKEFLDRHEEFTLESERELLPFRDRVDGAYVARWRKQELPWPPHGL